jgi:hypothetical protein
MEEWIRKIFVAAKERWHTKTGLFLVLLAVIGTLVFVFAGIDLGQVSRIEWGLIGAGGIAVVALWHVTAIPRAPKNRVGFGVAIQFEDVEHERKLHSDFLVTLRELLDSSRYKHQFAFVEFPKRLANQITDQEKALFVMKRARLHFFLYGRARLRTMAQGPSHVLDLRGIVQHAPVSKEVSEYFGKEFGRALPSRLIVGPENSMLGCEFAAKHIDAAARYVLGTAAALSMEFEFAEELLLDSERRVKSFVEDEDGSPISALLHSVRTRVVSLYQAWSGGLVQRYIDKRDLDALQKAELIIAKLQGFDRDNYNAHVRAALCAFVLHRDKAKARREIEACRKVADAAWSYSEAFLNAYDGDLKGAYLSYRRAFQSPLASLVMPIQCEVFIQTILDQEPERTWLYYCLGLINQRAKGDLRTARADYARFVERADPKRFGTEIEIVRKWIEEIDSKFAPGQD